MKKILIVLFIMILVLTGCTTDKSSNQGGVYKKITVQEAKSIIDKEEIIILDVRTKEEYDGGHIKNAVLLPVTDISTKASEVLKDKNAKILVYCRSGNRSATASNELIKMGYKNVIDFGGINSWPYEVVK